MALKLRRPEVTHRSVFLLAFGLLYGLIGWSYLQPIPRLAEILLHQSLAPLLEHVSLRTFGYAWLLVGAVMVVGGTHSRLNFIGFGVAMTMPASWAVIYLVAWRTGHNPRGWLTAAVYGCLVVAIAIVADMEEPRHERPRRPRR